ncbi:MAG: OmpA family protein [Acidobacteriota bacterium]
MNSQDVTRNPHPLANALWLLLIAVLLFSGCGKKTGPVRPPTAPGPAPTAPPSTPTTSLPPQLEARVEPQSIPPGESATLVWEARNADLVVIDQGIGEVDKSGRLKVFPTRTSSYRIVAVGPGGNTEKTVTLDVGKQPYSVAEDGLAGKSLAEQFVYFVKPVFFAYDSSELKDEAKLTLDGNIRWLVKPQNRSVGVILEGHTDERGTAEYNLALGDKRAQVVRAYMISHGVDPSRLITISLGEERPFDLRATEDAYALNRRVHFVLLEDRLKQR